MDAGNFGLNSVFGESAQVPAHLRGGFTAVDLFGNSVHVDVNASYERGAVLPVLVRRMLIWARSTQALIAGKKKAWSCK